MEWWNTPSVRFPAVLLLVSLNHHIDTLPNEVGNRQVFLLCNGFQRAQFFVRDSDGDLMFFAIFVRNSSLPFANHEIRIALRILLRQPLISIPVHIRRPLSRQNRAKSAPYTQPSGIFRFDCLKQLPRKTFLSIVYSYCPPR
jgi:hypothetical protein